MSNLNINTSGNLALKPEQAPTFDLVIVQKPAPITVGTVIHFKAFGVKADLPILMVIKDKWGRDFETYIVENPMWSQGGQAMPYMPIFSTSTWIVGYGETVALNAKQWLLLAAMQARENATRWKKFARRFKSRIVSTSTTQAIRTSKGFGFHDFIETELLEGDKARYEKRMKHAAYWQSVYDGLIAMIEVD